MRLRLASLAVLVLCAAAVGASAQTTDPANKPTPPTVTPTASFVQTAVVGNLFEVESSKLALERSPSAAVKTFAKHMIDDHSAAGVVFAEAVNQAKLPVTPPPFKLDAKHQAALDELRTKQGADFDKTYVDLQHRAHIEAIEMFKGYAASGEDSTLKATAAKLLPKLQQHLEQVLKLQAAQK
jgi:putative membrane protein